MLSAATRMSVSRFRLATFGRVLIVLGLKRKKPPIEAASGCSRVRAECLICVVISTR